MKKYRAVLVSAILLLQAGCGLADQSNEDPWGQGPKPPESEQQAQVQQVSQSNGQADGEQPKGHPAAEPPIPNEKRANCGHMHPGGLPPVIVNSAYREAIKPTFRQLCYRSFHLGHSGRTRTALWSAEVLDKRKIEMASAIKRESEFRADERLPENERSELEDYRRSGYDRGHLAPSGDMPSREAQEESFLLSNIVPQNGRMNGGRWRDLEINVRKEAKKSRVYVVSGPIFKGAKMTLKQRVLVPTSLYKAMYVVDKGAVVFIMSNDDNANTTTMSIDQFTEIYGIDPFPGLVGYVRKHNIALGEIPKEIPGKKKEEDSSAVGSGGESKYKPGCMMFMDMHQQWMTEEEFRARYGKNETPYSSMYCHVYEGRNQ